MLQFYGMSIIPHKRVNFYIDGFNFYYGLKRITEHKPDWRKFYWIDIVAFCSAFLSSDEELGKVKYFTSRPRNSDKMVRQNTLMRCNQKLNPIQLEIVYGRYANKELKCNAVGGCKKKYDDLEEKETDVNLAIQMVIDSYEKVCDKMVLISGDTDFVPPLKRIKNNHKHIETMILFPPGNRSTHLSQICSNNLDLEKQKPKWNKAILPNEVNFDDGTVIIIPDKWKLNNK